MEQKMMDELVNLRRAVILSGPKGMGMLEALDQAMDAVKREEETQKSIRELENLKLKLVEPLAANAVLQEAVALLHGMLEVMDNASMKGALLCAAIHGFHGTDEDRAFNVSRIEAAKAFVKKYDLSPGDEDGKESVLPEVRS